MIDPADHTFLSSDDSTRRMRRHAREIFDAGLAAADAAKAVLSCCRRQGDLLHLGGQVFDLSAIRRIFVIGTGKATAVMAQAIESLAGEHIADGLISVKYGHAAPLKRIQILEAGHPIPDSNSVMAAHKILAIAQGACADDLVIFLVSGGGSALLALPAQRISLTDKQAATRSLLACGADIHDINALRKHLSAIKGGRLAQAAWPARIVTLSLSDVVGDDPAAIASGPTEPDPSTFHDCLAIVRRFGLHTLLPRPIMSCLQAGAAGRTPETPKKETHDWKHTSYCIVGHNLKAIEAAARQARSLGYTPVILSSRIQGEAREAARVHAAIAREVIASGHPIAAPACILSGGETTVSLKGKGRGGRNQEFALAAASDIAGAAPIVLLSAGTDGTDGPTDAAGAFVDQTTLQRARQSGMEISEALENNDAYSFFDALGDLLRTGPTGTNVMDIQVMLIGCPR